MATYYLLNTVILGALQKFIPGDLVDDAVDPVVGIQAAGGILWPSSDATVASAAALVAAQRKSKAIDEIEAMALMLSGASASLKSGGAIAAATTSAPGTMSAADKLKSDVSMPTFKARGAVFANVSDLAAFTVASNDGLTYVAGERVLLANQTTAAQNGLYVVGTVATGTAPLTRAPEMPAAMAIVNGMIVEVSEGTLYAGSSWKAMCTGAKVVATDDPLFYPAVCKGTATLVAGTKTLGATEGLYLFSTTRSTVAVTLNTPNTVTSTVTYQAAVAGRTAGKSGTAALVLQANVAAGTINTADISTLDWSCRNW